MNTLNSNIGSEFLGHAKGWNLWRGLKPPRTHIPACYALWLTNAYVHYEMTYISDDACFSSVNTPKSLNFLSASLPSRPMFMSFNFCAVVRLTMSLELGIYLGVH